MDEKYLAAIDLGSSKVTLTVALAGDSIQILYHRSIASEGIRNSAILQVGKAEQCIRKLVRDAEDELKIKIVKAIVSLPKWFVRQETASADLDRNSPDDSITADEINNLKSLARDSFPDIDEDKEVILGVSAQSFNTAEDINLKENDIIGIISEKLGGNFKFFISKINASKAIDKVFTDLQIDTVKYFTPLTTHKAILTEDEKESGIALIDFGGDTTSVSVFKGNVLVHYASIPFGGKDVTNDIKSELVVPERLAENIKLAYGGCMPDKLSVLGDKVLRIKSEISTKEVEVKYLSEIITARESEIVEAMLYEIEKSGQADGLRSGIVITGGGARILNLGQMITQMSGYTVKEGRPRNLFLASGTDNIYDSTESPATLGMILAAKADNMGACAVEDDAWKKKDEAEKAAQAAAEEKARKEVEEERRREEEAKQIVHEPQKTAVKVKEVKLEQSEITLKQGKSERLKVTVLPYNATDKTVRWKSSDENVATVSQDGEVTVKKNASGAVIISAEAGGIKAECMVNVKQRLTFSQFGDKFLKGLYDNNNEV